LELLRLSPLHKDSALAKHPSSKAAFLKTEVLEKFIGMGIAAPGILNGPENYRAVKSFQSLSIRGGSALI
jgi:hypothetical protein